MAAAANQSAKRLVACDQLVAGLREFSIADASFNSICEMSRISMSVINALDESSATETDSPPPPGLWTALAVAHEELASALKHQEFLSSKWTERKSKLLDLASHFLALWTMINKCWSRRLWVKDNWQERAPALSLLAVVHLAAAVVKTHAPSKSSTRNSRQHTASPQATHRVASAQAVFLVPQLLAKVEDAFMHPSDLQDKDLYRQLMSSPELELLSLLALAQRVESTRHCLQQQLPHLALPPKHHLSLLSVLQDHHTPGFLLGEFRNSQPKHELTQDYFTCLLLYNIRWVLIGRVACPQPPLDTSVLQRQQQQVVHAHKHSPAAAATTCSSSSECGSQQPQQDERNDCSAGASASKTCGGGSACNQQQQPQQVHAAAAVVTEARPVCCCCDASGSFAPMRHALFLQAAWKPVLLTLLELQLLQPTVGVMWECTSLMATVIEKEFPQLIADSSVTTSSGSCNREQAELAAALGAPLLLQLGPQLLQTVAQESQALQRECQRTEQAQLKPGTTAHTTAIDHLKQREMQVCNTCSCFAKLVMHVMPFGVGKRELSLSFAAQRAACSSVVEAVIRFGSTAAATPLSKGTWYRVCTTSPTTLLAFTQQALEAEFRREQFPEADLAAYTVPYVQLAPAQQTQLQQQQQRHSLHVTALKAAVSALNKEQPHESVVLGVQQASLGVAATVLSQACLQLQSAVVNAPVVLMCTTPQALDSGAPAGTSSGSSGSSHIYARTLHGSSEQNSAAAAVSLAGSAAGSSEDLANLAFVCARAATTLGQLLRSSSNTRSASSSSSDTSSASSSSSDTSSASMPMPADPSEEHSTFKHVLQEAVAACSAFVRLLQAQELAHTLSCVLTAGLPPQSPTTGRWKALWQKIEKKRSAAAFEALVQGANGELNAAVPCSSGPAPPSRLRSLSLQVQQLGEALCAVLPVSFCCSNPYCCNIQGLSELQLVRRQASSSSSSSSSKKSCRCGGCRVVFYCSEECQHSHWKLHKPLCKAYRQ